MVVDGGEKSWAEEEREFRRTPSDVVGARTFSLSLRSYYAEHRLALALNCMSVCKARGFYVN